MGKLLKGTSYPLGKYVEAFFITVGVAVFSIASKSSDADTSTEIIGLLFMCMYVFFDCFTSQWQDKVYATPHMVVQCRPLPNDVRCELHCYTHDKCRIYC